MSNECIIALVIVGLVVIWFGLLLLIAYVSSLSYRMGVREGIQYLKGDRSINTQEAGELIRKERLDDWMRDARG